MLEILSIIESLFARKFISVSAITCVISVKNRSLVLITFVSYSYPETLLDSHLNLFLGRHIAVTHEKVRVNCFVESCRFSVGRKDYLRNHIILSHRELTEDVKNAYLAKIRDMKL